MFHSHNILYALHTVKIEVTLSLCICVKVYAGIFIVYQYIYGIPVFLWFTGKEFFFDFDTGMTKLPSFISVHHPALLHSSAIFVSNTEKVVRLMKLVWFSLYQIWKFNACGMRLGYFRISFTKGRA